MTDLFSAKPIAPLAEALRPQRIAEVVGQAHLLGPGKPLQLAVQARKLHSLVFWGPPGVGKTTLGRLLAREVGSEFMTLSAVLAGAKEIRQVVDAAQHILDHQGRTSVLFLDEIHRFNKAQQDLLLPHVESGLLTLCASTTENPSFELNNALLSRAQVYVLHPLSAQELGQLYERAVPRLSGVSLTEEVLAQVVGLADGDGRRFLNLVEQLATAAQGAGRVLVDTAFSKDALGTALRRFDKSGEAHYDQTSALHKSIRGSHPDAALYWLARMLDGGADARYIARRLVVIASEDVGNADPRALQLALNAAQAYERLGAAEGERALAQAAVYLAVAPKSNAVYTAWNAARAYVRSHPSQEVPMHLRNAPTQLMKDLGYHEGYRYAHDEPHAYAAGENYLPAGMPEPGWYQPSPRGLEIRIGEKLQSLAALDQAHREAAAAPK